MTHSTEPTRLPKGVPAGGEFAQGAQSKPDMDNNAEQPRIDDTSDARTPMRPAGQVGEHPPSIASRLAQLKHGDSVILTKDG